MDEDRPVVYLLLINLLGLYNPSYSIFDTVGDLLQVNTFV